VQLKIQRLQFLIFIAAIFFVPIAPVGQELPVRGTSYYVDSVSGDDANPGTSPANAWKSFQKLNATTFLPGDRILLKSGSAWSGQLWPKGSGREGAPIVIDMYGDGVLPVINGEGLAEDAVLLKNQEYWEIQDLEITNHGNGSGVRRGVHIDADNAGELHHVYLRSLRIHDVNGSDAVKHNGGINYTCEGDQKPSRFVDLRIENNQIYRVDRSGIFGWSTHWVRSKWYPTLGLIVRGNQLSDIGGDGIVVVAADGALVEHNVVGHANQRSEGYNVAIWPWSSDNTIVQYNEAYGTHGQRDGEGFDSDWNSRGTIIQYNFSHDNDGGFLLICNEGGHTAEESAGNVGTIARYNISVNDRTRGINIAGPVKDTQIYNNTIYVGKGHHVDLLQHTDWVGWADSTYIYNNIFYVEGSAEIAYGISRNPDGGYVTASGFGKSTNNVLDYNVYSGNIDPLKEAHALTSDPMLQAPGQIVAGKVDWTGYRLRPGSPAQDSGRVIKDNGQKDAFGTPVLSCKGADRGAVESSTCGLK
jgi:hypothetical protein